MDYYFRYPTYCVQKAHPMRPGDALDQPLQILTVEEEVVFLGEGAVNFSMSPAAARKTLRNLADSLLPQANGVVIILLVEDEALIRELSVVVLEDAAFRRRRRVTRRRTSGRSGPWRVASTRRSSSPTSRYPAKSTACNSPTPCEIVCPRSRSSSPPAPIFRARTSFRNAAGSCASPTPWMSWSDKSASWPRLNECPTGPPRLWDLL